MDNMKVGFIGGILLMVSLSVQAQGINQAIREDRKKILLDQVKPSIETYKSPRESKQTVDIAVDKKKYLGNPQGLTGGAMFEDKYTISPHISSIDIQQLVKPKFGEQTKVMLVNGKFTIVPVKDYEHILDRMSQKHRLQGLMISSGIGGLNLSGYNKKKISERSKMILRTVFGMEVEDDN